MHSSSPTMINVVKEKKTYDNYNALVARVLGSLQITLGIFSIVCNAIALAFYVELAFIGYGFWIPVFWFIGGAFGITSSFRKSKCWIVTTMVMNILAASFNAVYVSLAIAQFILIPNEYDYDYGDGCDYSYEYDYEHRCHKAVQYSMSSLMLGTAVLETCVAIVAAAFCCRVVCCKIQNNRQTPCAGKYVTVNSPYGTQRVFIPFGYQLVREGDALPPSVIIEDQEQLTDDRDIARILP